MLLTVTLLYTSKQYKLHMYISFKTSFMLLSTILNPQTEGSYINRIEVTNAIYTTINKFIYIISFMFKHYTVHVYSTIVH